MGKLLFSGTALLVAGGFLLVACCVFACAGAFIFGLAGDYENDAQAIEDLSEFSAGGDNSKVYATGTITDSAVITDDAVVGDIAEYEFVGYRVDRWDVKRDTSSSGSNNRTRNTFSGNWRDVSSFFGPFALDSGKINVLPDDTATLEGDVHETLVPGTGTNGYSATYDGRTVKDGTYRLQGFQNGDLITVMGIRRDGENLNAEKMYGGTRDEWIEELKGQAEDSRTAGYVLGGCGLCFLLPGLAIAAASVFGRRLFKTSSNAPSMNPTTAPYGTFGSGTVNTPFGQGSQSAPFGQSGQSGQPGQSGQFGSSTPPPSSNIPSGSFWSGQGSPSPFNPPADAPSPFDAPKADDDAQ